MSSSTLCWIAILLSSVMRTKDLNLSLDEPLDYRRYLGTAPNKLQMLLILSLEYIQKLIWEGATGLQFKTVTPIANLKAEELSNI